VSEAQRQGALVSEAQRQGALVSKAQRQGALVSEAQRQGALVSEAQRQGALVSKAQRQGALVSKAQRQGADALNILPLGQGTNQMCRIIYMYIKCRARFWLLARLCIQPSCERWRQKQLQ
jgi:hypothetical protein